MAAESEKEQLKSIVSANYSWEKVIVLDGISGNNILDC
jgi:hypothetical protein